MSANKLANLEFCAKGHKNWSVTTNARGEKRYCRTCAADWLRAKRERWHAEGKNSRGYLRGTPLSEQNRKDKR